MLWKGKNLMAIIKILRCRGQSGSNALDYVIYKHDESSRAPVLDESGNRVKEVPVKRGASGKAVIEIGPQYRTVWYEITVQ